MPEKLNIYARSIEELIATLFVSEEGEIREMPEFAGKERVVYQIPKKPLRFPIDPADAMKPVEYEQQFWDSLTSFHPAAQKAICRLYRERAAAQCLALDWYHESVWGPPMGSAADGVKQSELAKRSRELERAVDEEMRRR